MPEHPLGRVTAMLSIVKRLQTKKAIIAMPTMLLVSIFFQRLCAGFATVAAFAFSSEALPLLFPRERSPLVASCQLVSERLIPAWAFPRLCRPHLQDPPFPSPFKTKQTHQDISSMQLACSPTTSVLLVPSSFPGGAVLKQLTTAPPPTPTPPAPIRGGTLANSLNLTTRHTAGDAVK